MNIYYIDIFERITEYIVTTRNHSQEEFEDTKEVIRIRKSKKNRQHNDQKDKQRSTKDTHKAKDRVTRTPLKTGKSRCWQYILRSYNISVALSNTCYYFYYIECSHLSFCLCKIMCYPSEFCFCFCFFLIIFRFCKLRCHKKTYGLQKYPSVPNT